MSDSILETIKTMLGPTYDDTYFDTDIIVHINAAFMVLTQIGAGPTSGFSITGSEETWSDFLVDASSLSAVKQYVYLRTKLAFDSNTDSSATINSIKELIKELEWRINLNVD